MNEWFRQAGDPKVVRRALICMAVVGAVLIAINHGDALLRGELTAGRIGRMALTLLVPYVVSTVSSVGALRAVVSDRAYPADEQRRGSSG